MEKSKDSNRYLDKCQISLDSVHEVSKVSSIISGEKLPLSLNNVSCFCLAHFFDKMQKTQRFVIIGTKLGNILVITEDMLSLIKMLALPSDRLNDNDDYATCMTVGASSDQLLIGSAMG